MSKRDAVDGVHGADLALEDDAAVIGKWTFSPLDSAPRVAGLAGRAGGSCAHAPAPVPAGSAASAPRRAS